ncbi:MAG: ATP-dependent helicase [Gammaproteobacteria bacterium]|nr:MAG: ATP-dependent helicase [Gammaproteobacteria bacterium]
MGALKVLKDISLNRGLQLGLNSLNLKKATDVQAEVIPAALAGQDLLISAETGSGKTLAYLIPSAQRVLDGEHARNAGTLVLVLVPTRELARQVAKHFAALAFKTPLQCGVITGGNSYKYQQAILRKNPEFIVSTPGRLVELLADGSADLASLQTLILDEADRMLDMGFRDDVLAIIGSCNATRQTLLVSATLEHAGVNHIARDILTDPVAITIGSARSQHSDIHQQVILSDDKNHKEKLLAALLKTDNYGKALVFSNTRVQADQLGGLLSYHKLRAGVLHGDMTQEERNQVIGLFAQGRVTVLVGSDVAARGLDVKDIDMVINFDLPRSVDDYIHRIGRTGRAGRKGLAVSFITANDWNLMVTIERYLGTSFERRVLKGLKARFKGPKKLKSNGKAAGTRKKRSKLSDKSATRHRTTKNKGKRKSTSTGGEKVYQRSTDTGEASSDGFSPLMRKPLTRKPTMKKPTTNKKAR